MAWSKSIVQWTLDGVLYLSVPFTWLLGEAEAIASTHKGKVIAGGPAVMLMGATWANETPASTPFDVLAMHNPLATYTTRGCPNKCRFCAVPIIDGPFIEWEHWRHAPIVCDNNLLAASRFHFEKVVDSLRPFPMCDLQGLEAKRLTGWHLDLLRSLSKPLLRFGFDHTSMESPVADAVARCTRAGFKGKDIRVYVLIGFDDTPDEARYRLELVRSWDALPFPQRYQPLDATEKDRYVAPGWTDAELRRMQRYYSRLIHLGHIPYDDYNPVGETLFPREGRA